MQLLGERAGMAHEAGMAAGEFDEGRVELSG
jgi:hypothetical protein